MPDGERQPSDSAPVRSPSDRSADSGTIGGKLVLVVDDDRQTREMVSLVLEVVLGVRTVGAGDGEEALRLAGERKPSLILLDLDLPKLDGFEVTRRLRAGVGAAPVIALTALSTVETREKAYAAGCDDCIFKPFDLDCLIDKLALYLGRNTRDDHCHEHEERHTNPSSGRTF